MQGSESTEQDLRCGCSSVAIIMISENSCSFSCKSPANISAGFPVLHTHMRMYVFICKCTMLDPKLIRLFKRGTRDETLCRASSARIAYTQNTAQPTANGMGYRPWKWVL